MLNRLLSRWVISGAGVLLLAVLIWIFGPLLAALSETLPRLILVAAVLAIWAITNLLLDRRRRRREKTLEAGVAAPPADNTAREAAEEQAALAGKLTEALATLRKARGTRGYLYEQPWYVIIGPPGAGKTTALLNSGLSFPLGDSAVAGVGGTRLCDWWFTDQAVLIDTAGRYTTQEGSTVDKAGWQGFLGLLKRTRPRQPLNGVLVAIALTDIAQAPREDRRAHARAIRARIRELDDSLGLRLPVYAIFTKGDLIAGFTEYFDDLDRERRDQVWGMTFDPASTAGEPVAAFAAELERLVTRLRERLFDRLQAERSPDRRGLIAGFPTQIATLAEPLGEFLNEAFGGSKLDPAPFLRGVFFASGTQAGTPIDRLTGAMARNFGLDQQRLPSLRPERGRSYFLGGLLRQLIFGEAMLVSERAGAARRRWLARAGAFAAIAVVALLAVGAMLAARATGQRQVADTAKALDGYEAAARRVPLDPVADADLPSLLPVLDAARTLTDQTVPHGVGFGLSQAGKLHAGAQAVYRHALQYGLLPRMVWRLETQMRGNLQRPDFLYEATRVYLMLGGQGPLDRDLVRDWMTLDWRTAFAGVFDAAQLAALQAHLDRLLSEPLPPVPLDGGLVAEARAGFSRVSLAQRVYDRIRPSTVAAELPPWRPIDAVGPAGADVIVRASGKPLTDGIPGFLTVRGFHLVLLPALPAAAREVAAESWVLGRDEKISLDAATLRGLEHDVVELYEHDYETEWDRMLADLDVVPLRSPSEAAQDLYILTSPQSPIKSLLVSVATQLTLSTPPPGTAAPAKTINPLSATVAESARLSSLLGVGTASAATLPPGSEVDAHYAALRQLASRDNGAAIDQALKPLSDLQQLFAKIAAAPIGSATPAAIGPDPIQAVRASAPLQPQPLQRWMLAMAEQGAALRGGDAKQQVAASFNGPTGPASLCPLAVNGRFPFVSGSTLDTPLDDFTKLFAPGGMLDGFFNTQLRPYVNTSGKVWAPQSANGVAPPVTPDAVAQFQRAASIRDLFFAGGGATPTVKFTITPVKLDDGANQVSLDFGGVSVVYSHGPPRATEITWPGPQGMQDVRLVFDPAPAGGTGVLSSTGPWALFRMFGQGQLAQGASTDSYTLSYTLGNRQAVFAIRAGSVLNPFAPGLLQDFRCPVVQ